MLSHANIWDALDLLAQSLSTSPSGLARKAGLDPTTFNKSKRITAAGKQRWPSTESLAKVLRAVGMDFEDFARITNSGHVKSPCVPSIGLAQAANEGIFDEIGRPTGEGWEGIHLSNLRDKNIYALKIAGDSMSPTFRNGDHILVDPSSYIRRGDRIVVKTHEGEVLAKELRKLTGRFVELLSLNPEYEDQTLPIKDVQWMARIIWASQ